MLIIHRYQLNTRPSKLLAQAFIPSRWQLGSCVIHVNSMTQLLAGNAQHAEQ